jgi:YbbR domain-containing protein
MNHRLFNNLDIKIVSVLIAILLWAFVITDKDYESSVPASVLAWGMRSGLILVEDFPAEIPVRLKAKGRDLIRMRFKRYHPLLKIDLSGFSVGRTSFFPHSEDVEIPTNIPAKPIRILSSRPISVVLDTLWEKRVRVSPSLEGEPADGFTLSGLPASNPPWVILKGPKQFLLRLETVSTRPVNVEGKESSFSEKVDLDHSTLRLVQTIPESVTVSVSMESMAEKVFSNIPLRIIDEKHRFGTILTPAIIELLVQGRARDVSQLRDTNIIATVEVTDLPSGTHWMPARIELPKGFALKSASPERFRVILK